MRLTTETFGNVIIVHTPDDLTSDNAAEVERYLSSLPQSRIVLDLDNTEAIDSAGLKMLLNVQEALRSDGGDLKLMVTNPVNRKILEITRLDQQLDVYDTVVDAVKSFG
jgi:anti-anti-sigma factor